MPNISPPHHQRDSVHQSTFNAETRTRFLISSTPSASSNSRAISRLPPSLLPCHFFQLSAAQQGVNHGLYIRDSVSLPESAVSRLCNLSWHECTKVPHGMHVSRRVFDSGVRSTTVGVRKRRAVHGKAAKEYFTGPHRFSAQLTLNNRRLMPFLQRRDIT